MMRRLLGGFTLAAALCLAPAAVAQTLTPTQKDEVRGLVRDYIKQNPQVVEEALTELQRRKDVAMRQRIEGDARDFSVGPRTAPVTIVEFFDYRCPYCHSAMEWVFEVVRRNPQQVRVIFKEFPVLGPESLVASKAVLASIRQGRYQPFHRAVMSFRGDLNDAQIDTLARSAGVDVARMRRDMGDAALLDHLQANHDLAREANIEGTPAFLINGVWVRGWDKASADRAVADALRASRQKRK